MFTKPNAESLAKERASLEEIKQKRNALVDAVGAKRNALAEQARLVARLQTPEGVLDVTDAEIERQEKALRNCRREVARAEGELQKYTQGPAANLEGRERELATQEFHLAHYEALAEYRAKLTEYLETAERMKGLEQQFGKLAKAAGFQRAIIGLFTSARGEKTAWDDVRFDIASTGLDLLDGNDPQLTLWKRQRGIAA